MRVKLCLVAEGIVRDAETNSISVYNILEGITANGFPLLVQRMAFLALFERDESEPEAHAGHFTVSLGDNQLLTGEQRINFRGKLRTRSIVRIQGLLFPTPGEARFALAVGEGVTAAFVVRVRATAAASPRLQVADA